MKKAASARTAKMTSVGSATTKILKSSLKKAPMPRRVPVKPSLSSCP
jgi:hypothetical protein